MEKINFVNGTTIDGASTFNAMQQNIENAINEVVETGSNQYGTYIKYANGDVIQYGKYTISSDGVQWSSLGNYLFCSSGAYIKQLPIKVVDLTNYHVNVNSRSTNYDWAVREIIANTNEATYINFDLVTVTNAARNITINWEVIGKWK